MLLTVEGVDVVFKVDFSTLRSNRYHQRHFQAFLICFFYISTILLGLLQLSMASMVATCRADHFELGTLRTVVQRDYAVSS